MTDPLDRFLSSMPPVPDDEPDYPGKTPPKNRGDDKPPDQPDDDLFNGARPQTYRMGGVDREFFTIGELARALRRKPVTIRMWEQRGWIPKANYRTPAPVSGIPNKPNKGRRLYSREQVEFLIAMVQAYRLGRSSAADWEGFKKHVRQSWPV